MRPWSSDSHVPCWSRSRLTPRPAGTTPNRRRRYPSISPASYPGGIVASRKPGLNVRRCSSARTIVQSGFSRPMTVSHQRSRCSIRESRSAAEQTGRATSKVWPTSRPVNDAGTTPTTVNGRSRIVSELPIGRLATAQVRLPERVTDHRRSGAASGMIVTAIEQPSTFWCDAEHGEEVTTHPEAARRSCLDAAACEELGIPPGKHAGKGALVSANQFPQRVGGFRVDAFVASERLRTISSHFGQLLRIGDDEGAEPYRIDQMKDGGVRTDPERQRQNGDGREDRAPAQDPQSISHVADDVLGQAHLVHSSRFRSWRILSLHSASKRHGAPARLR